MNGPRVSIGLPVYNGENYLRRSIDSILAQDFEDFELIIADNASSDGTESICREYAAADKRVRYYRNDTNLGAAANYNKVFHLARGEFFKWAAHDDECHPAMIRKCVEALDRAPPSVSMVYPLGELIDENGNTLSAPLDRIAAPEHWPPYRRIAHVFWALNMCDPIFGLIRSSHLRKTGLIGPFFGADYVLLGELAMLGEIREVDEVLFRLRAHPKRSMRAHKGRRERAAWYDPSSARALFVLPGWERMVWEMTKSAYRLPLPFATRTSCCASAVVTHYWRRFRNAGGRVKEYMKERLGAQPGSRDAEQGSR